MMNALAADLIVSKSGESGRSEYHNEKINIGESILFRSSY